MLDSITEVSSIMNAIPEYWQAVILALQGIRIGVVIRDLDGVVSPLQQAATISLREMGADVAVLKPEEEDLVWACFGESDSDRDNQLGALSVELFLVGRVWRQTDEFLGERDCVSAVVYRRTWLMTSMILSLHNPERSLHWPARALAHGLDSEIPFTPVEPATRPETIWELIEVLRDQSDEAACTLLNLDFLIKHGDVDMDWWRGFAAGPITPETVASLAEGISTSVGEALYHTSDAVLYATMRQECHVALQQLAELCHKHGIEVPELDGPLTPSEQLEACGMVTITDGQVHLTEEGEEAARQVESEIERGLADPLMN